ncbi:MAG: hypothetical protein R2761_16165 [Acidimicrobiales bacterium]
MTTWVTRQQWGARPPKLTRPLSGFNSGWFIHWLGEPAAAGLDDHQVLRNTQRYHMDSKGWVDIAYSFAVGRSHPDTAYELRGWGVQGGHTEGHNSQSMAIVFLLGTGERPTDTQLTTAREILAEGVNRGYSAKLVRPHNAVRSTACPGPDLTGWVNAGRFFAQPPKETTVPTTTPTSDAMVEQWQRMLLDNGARLGDAGPDRDGADGLFGRLTLEASKVILDHRNQLLATVEQGAVLARKAEEAVAALLHRAETAEARAAQLEQQLAEAGTQFDRDDSVVTAMAAEIRAALSKAGL